MHCRSSSTPHALPHERPSTKDTVGIRSCMSAFRWVEAVWSCDETASQRAILPPPPPAIYGRAGAHPYRIFYVEGRCGEERMVPQGLECVVSCETPKSDAIRQECRLWRIDFPASSQTIWMSTSENLPSLMSEVRMFMNQQDTQEFVEWLISSFRLTFVEEWSHDLPLPTHNSCASVSSRIRGPGHHRRFALVSPTWSTYPLVTSYIVPTNGSKPLHCLCQRYGGPSFDLIASRVAKTDSGEPFIISGSFSDYATYFVEQGQPESIRRPAEMASIWKQVQSYFRRNGRRTTCREGNWIGPFVMRHALKDYANGTWLRSGSDHYDPRN
jgi:hypothetical protein